MKETFSKKELSSMWNRVKEPTIEDLIEMIKNQKEESEEFQKVVLRKLLEIYEEMTVQRRRIEKLEREGTGSGSVSPELKEMTIKEAKPLVEAFLRGYLKMHNKVYPSDVADKLGIRYELTRRIFRALEKEGKLEKKGTVNV